MNTINRIASGLLLLMSAPLQAAVINLDVSDLHGQYSGTGAAADTGIFWNLASGLNDVYSNLTASDGVTATSVYIGFRDWLSEHPWDASHALSDRMYGPAAGSAFIDITGLQSGNAYDLYLYASDHNTRFSAPGVAGEIASSSGQIGNWGSPWTEGMEYVLLEGVVADLNGSIIVTAFAGAGTATPTTWTSIAAIQIDGDSSPTTITAPASLRML